ncbi:MAG: hypothetical protein HY719_03380, partial [Planctomycetes bacterium]|nr:hypothetical protein [Planctomycetota bacterium]
LGAARLPSDGYGSTYVNVTGDTMTGTLALPANGLSVGSTQLLVAGGNVGVGTLSPAARLEIQTEGAGNRGLEIIGAANQSEPYLRVTRPDGALAFEVGGSGGTSDNTISLIGTMLAARAALLNAYVDPFAPGEDRLIASVHGQWEKGDDGVANTADDSWLALAGYVNASGASIQGSVTSVAGLMQGVPSGVSQATAGYFQVLTNVPLQVGVAAVVTATMANQNSTAGVFRIESGSSVVSGSQAIALIVQDFATGEGLHRALYVDGVQQFVSGTQSGLILPNSTNLPETSIAANNASLFYRTLDNTLHVNRGGSWDEVLTAGLGQTVTGQKTWSGTMAFSSAPSFNAAGAPFTVSSTTVVTNLNADLLDGQEGAYYRDASNLNAGTLGAARLPSDGYGSTYVNVTGDTMTGTLALPSSGLTVGSTDLAVYGGNVGVGTLIAGQKLSVVGGFMEVKGANDTGLILQPTGAGGETWELRAQRTGESFPGFFLRNGTESNNYFYVTDAGLVRLGLPTASLTSATGLNIDASGLVGIGTLAPNARLHAEATAGGNWIILGKNQVGATDLTAGVRGEINAYGFGYLGYYNSSLSPAILGAGVYGNSSASGAYGVYGRYSASNYGYLGANGVGLYATGTTYAADLSGPARVSGTLTVATNALVVEATSSMVGIHTTAPTAALDIRDEDNTVELGTHVSNGWTDANGIIGFPGYGTRHGEIAFYPNSSAFALVDSSASDPAGDYGTLSHANLNFIDIWANQGIFESNVGVGTITTNEKITLDGALSMREQASAPSNTSSYGKLYVKSADGSLYFKDGAGTETKVLSGGAGGAVITVVKSADVSLLGDATLNDDSELQFPMAANSVYQFEIQAIYSTFDNANIRFALNGPAGVNWLQAYVIATKDDSPTNVVTLADITAYESAIVPDVLLTTRELIRISGSVSNGATSGNLIFRWAQGTSQGALATKIHKGSYIVAHKAQ